MSDAIIVAIIALIGEIVIAGISNSGIIARLDKQSSLADSQIHGEIEVIKQEMTGLRKEVEKHNNLIARTYKLEQDVAVHEEKIKVANNRISDLESKGA